LVTGEYAFKQTSSQEKDYARLYLVNVPANPEDRKLPVIIFLHGNGGSARGSANVFKRFPVILRSYVTVVADGYRASWNISGERSKADDRKFIESIVESLAGFDNVQKEGFTIIGNSNGAALVNQLAIESQLPNIRNYVAVVSQLNTRQHDGKNFRAMGANGNYLTLAKPRQGVRILNVSGVGDRLIPYDGGPSPIPSKDGKLGFVAAEQSIFLWAQAMGHKGAKLKAPTRSEGQTEVFSYLDGAVVHFKVLAHGHNAFSALSEEHLLSFLRGGKPAR
ncbi:MAG: hypothetical protein O3C21_11255, partial [Verrucomicrobia bacterium]|nr:hypothetical protein [Verrucomicrobiota bacterium]